MNATRKIVTTEAWREAGRRLQSGELSLIGLWGEPGHAHLAFLDNALGELGALSVACEANRYPSIGLVHPPAIRLERALRDLEGLEAEGSPDVRPWLRHVAPYPFLPVEGESLHQIPVGPVHAGIIEPGHFRFTASGETVVRLEARLGYVHKGIAALMAGAPLERAASLAARASGDSTVAYSWAFARGVEAALAAEVPARATWLRALAAELERIANHLGDIGAICNDAAFAILHAHCGLLRERVLRAAHACFGHRLMMDCVIPGGTSRDLAVGGERVLLELVATIRKVFPDLVEVYDNTASLKDRTVGTGIVSPALVRQFAAGGYVGRASGRVFDARRLPGYAPYEALKFEVPYVHAGDVNARVWIRIREVDQSLGLIEEILGRLPPGPVFVPPATHASAAPREAMAMVEGFRGDIFAWVRMDGAGNVGRCYLRDPSWFQWPLLEAAIEGNIVADFPLCNKSFNCSYAGHDL
jgi:Ni,Fe-hydrogenase III large subunit